MFARFGRGDCVLGMLIGIAANRHGMNSWIREHGIDITIYRDVATVFVAELFWILRTGGTYGGDLALFGAVNRRYVRGRNPSVSDDSNVVFFHAIDLWRCPMAFGYSGAGR